MKKYFFYLLLVSLSLTSCKFKDLHHGLQETDADEVLVLLHEHGIEAIKEAEKVSGQDTVWKIEVEGKSLEAARQLLVSHHLPRLPELGFSGVYKDKGLIPTPDEQQARFLLALKGEIVNSIKKIPGVVDADVVLNVPTENEFSEFNPVKKRPTASVVIRTRGEEDMTMSVTEAKIQRFVANSVPNLDPNDVVVIVTRIPNSSAYNAAVATNQAAAAPMPLLESQAVMPANWIVIGGMKMDVASVKKFKTYMVGLLSLLLVVSVGLLLSLVRVNRVKAQLQGETVALAPYEGEGQEMLGGGGDQPGVAGTFNMGNKLRQ